MSNFQPVIKWSGSKRSQAKSILSYFPNNYNNYYEPFIGGGSMLYAVNPKSGYCGDICKPLIDLWNTIKDSPNSLSTEYEKRWNRLQTEGYEVYYEIRNNFNANQNPYDLLFLSRTCVNGLIRFNSNGEFNNSLHHTRPGISPKKLELIINDWSNHIQNVTFKTQDYKQTTLEAQSDDIIYLDPPYFHTKGRYYGGIDFDDFFNYLEDLNKRKIRYILSFDGKRGDNDYTIQLPETLYKRHEYIESGNSAFRKLMDKTTEKVLESIYLNW